MTAKCHTHVKVQDTPKRRRESKGEKGSKTITPRRVGTRRRNNRADGKDI